MKSAPGNRIFLFWAALTLATALPAHAERPNRAQPSPWALVGQMIGDSYVEIEYSRPAVRGRVVWGELVPYGEVWRAGANDRTSITFEDDVEIDGHALAAGTYGLLVLPNRDAPWTVIFSKDFMSHGSDNYTSDNDALRVEVTPHDAEHREWLQYGFENLTETGADLYLHWEKRKLVLSISLAE